MTHRWKRWLAPTAAVTVVATLAACSSGSSGSGSPERPAASAAGSGVAKAQQMVHKFEAPLRSYPLPATPVSGVSALRGKTFYYVPLVQSIPGFVVTAATLKVALAKVGAKLQVCNGQAQPAAIGACIGQAAGASAAGIILDSIPPGMAQNAITAANGKRVPVIITDQIPPAGFKNTDLLTYVEGAITQPEDMAYWIISDSRGKANLIINEEADSPSSISYVQSSLAIYKHYCPGCTVAVKQTNSALSQSAVASDTSSNLLRDPGADYYYTEFENTLQPVMQGIQESSKTSINLSTAGGSVAGLGLLAKGSTPLKAEIVVDQAFAGYALADEILRMAAKSAPVQEQFPTRLFTQDNIATIQVTASAQASGAWFGNGSYRSAFYKLWGVS